MMQRNLVAIAIIVTLAGCATGKKETLGDLGELDIKIDTDAPITGARDKAMDNYWEFMAGAKEETQKAEALRRLADLEMERSEERFQQKMEVGVAGQAGVDDKSLRLQIYGGAIKLYEDALKVAGGGAERAGILYQVSKAYEQAGLQEKALDALTKLLAISPDAPNRDELHFRRGELLFDLRQFKQADVAYAQVLRVGDGSSYYEKALNKRGWAAFKQGKYKAALQSFFVIVDRKLKVKSAGLLDDSVRLSRGDQELVDDVFRVIILAFDELGGAKAIQEYFNESGHRDYEIRVYDQLAKFYLEKERVKDAADTYAAFAVAYPLHEQSFEFDLRAIETFVNAGFSQPLIEMKRNFVRKYRVNGPFWRRYQEQEDTILAKLSQALEANSEDVAKHLHAEAQKTKSPTDYQQAFLWYRQHLKWFGKQKNAQKMNFLYSELLFEAGSYETAAKEYEKTAYGYVRSGKNAEAGYAALLAYAEQEKKATGRQKEVWSRLSVGSALRFGKTFPQDKRAAEVLTKAAQDMFALGKYDQAAVFARQILELSHDASNDTRRTAWKIIARAEFEKGDYARAEVAYKVVLSLTRKGDADRKLLEDGLAASVYKQGEYMKSKGNLQAAITQFSRVEEVSPDSAIKVSAEFDIAASKMAAKDWDGAITGLLQFRAKNPEHPLAQRVPDSLVTAYLETGQSLKAAEELERMVGIKKNPEDKRAAMWQAAELYEKAGAGQQMQATYKTYIEMFPKPLEQAMEARQKLATVYAKTHRAEDEQYWLQEIIRTDKEGGAQSTPRTHYLAATAAYKLAQPIMKSYQQVKLVSPLKQNLRRKKQKLQEAVDAYTLAAEYGIEEVATASVYWLGEIYNEFSRDLMASERPQGLSEDELEQYNILLEEQAYPFEEKSITIHETNIGRIADGTYDEWVKKSLEKLKKLNPVRYAKAEKSEALAQIMF